MIARGLERALAISLDMDGTLYRVRKFRVLWRLRAQRRLLVALLAARERIRREGAFEDEAALRLREATLVALTLQGTVDEVGQRLSDLRMAMAGALTSGVPPFEGVKEALETAHSAGLKLAVLSDYDVEEKLRNLELGDVPWSAALGSDRAGALKPHPRSFLRVAALLGVDPSRIVHVGDRENLDVEGAHRAGMRAWRFAPRGGGRSAAEYVFSRWSRDLFSPLFRGTGGRHSG